METNKERQKEQTYFFILRPKPSEKVCKKPKADRRFIQLTFWTAMPILTKN